jgi:hypothetical protein
MKDVIAELRVPKRTGTHADIFAAVGLAELLASIPGTGNVRIVERATAFEIHPPKSLDDTALGSIPPTPGYLYLVTTNLFVALARGC